MGNFILMGISMGKYNYMKQKFFAILIFAGAFSPAFAQSVLKVSLADKSPITVSLDGRYFNKRGETITIADLPQGKHYLKIFSYSGNHRDAKVVALIYEGKIKTHSGRQTLFVFDPNAGTTAVVDVDMSNNEPANAPGQNAERFNNRNLDKYDTRQEPVNDEINHLTKDPITEETPHALPPGTPLASPVSSDSELNALEKSNAVKKEQKAVKPAKPLKDPKLEKARKKVAAKTTDTDRLAVAKQCFANEKLTTAQIIVILGWFDFENSKVDFAKWAYPNATDKDNYKKIKSKLSMKNYRADFDKFLK